jgi:hypothetical protein
MRARLCIAAAVVVAAMGTAFMFRYEPMGGAEPHLVWDRWTHTACVVAPTLGIACSRAELAQLWRSPPGSQASDFEEVPAPVAPRHQ